LTNVEKSQLLANVDTSLSAIYTPQQADYTNTPVAKNRAAGQYANMNNTNATGYAYLADISGWNKQRWEWLHIRGAGLGGSTDSTNLVAGVRDANTHMIPFESNIRSLATAVNGNPNYSSLQVQWSVQNRKEPHAYEYIDMGWELVKQNKTTAKDLKGKARFEPLLTGKNISKKEVELLESTLKEVRDGMTK